MTNKIDEVDHTYTMNGSNLESVTEMEDLSIIINWNLSWKNHIKKICSKANRQIWLIIRTMSLQARIKDKLIAYPSMTRSIIEYRSGVWATKYKQPLKSVVIPSREKQQIISSTTPHNTHQIT